MLHALIILLFALLAVHDAAPVEAGASVRGGLAAAGVAVGGPLAVWLAAHARLWRLGRALSRTGDGRLVARARRTVAVARALMGAAYAAAVVGLGWPEAVRAVVGDLIVIDEALIVAPTLLGLCALWWSYFPIERRLGDARILGALDAGDPVAPTPTRWQYVEEQSRRHVLAFAVPLVVLMAWWEATAWAATRWLPPEAGEGDGWWMALFGATQLVGVLGLLWVMPAILTRLWPTVPLGPGPLRDRLEALCRAQGIRVRRLLVWRTMDNMLNGALVGVAPPFRAILLTDTLLERLPIAQVEAVMAHEVAHARRRHLPWLLAVIALSAWGVYLAWTAAVGVPEDRVGLGMAMAASAGGALAVFGLVSRRFERQADAFAAQHLSGARPGAMAGVAVTPEAVGAMASALMAVGRLNGADPSHWSFRHGSILGRVRALHALVGRPADGLAIDRAVRGIKLGIVALGVVVVGVGTR
jgi:STE24 endopeptidase